MRGLGMLLTWSLEESARTGKLFYRKEWDVSMKKLLTNLSRNFDYPK
jgi:hypothetical protein